MDTLDKTLALAAIIVNVLITLAMVPFFNHAGAGSLVLIIPVVTCTLTMILVNATDLIFD